MGTVAIKNDILFIADFSGLFHCLDAKTGKVHWTYDMFTAAWGSPLIVEDKVYIGNEDGDICVFGLSANPEEAMVRKPPDDPNDLVEYGPVSVNYMNVSVYTTPIVANNVLYIANQNTLFAITPGGK